MGLNLLTILNKADSDENMNSIKENDTNTAINESDAGDLGSMSVEEFLNIALSEK